MSEVDLTSTLRKILDEMDLDQIARAYGPPETDTAYAEPQGYWKPGDGPPLIRPTPAEGQAIGRCAAARVRLAGAVFGSLHPGECGWCAYPVDELLRACDYATWQSRAVVAEWATWTFRDRTYRRSTNRHGYDNPTFAAFWNAPASVRQRDIDLASGRAVSA